MTKYTFKNEEGTKTLVIEAEDRRAAWEEIHVKYPVEYQADTYKIVSEEPV